MIRYRAVSRKHKMCRGQPPKGLHRRMKTFWLKHELGTCDGAILAYHKKELIGFFRYYKRKRGETLYAAGTYVMKPYRREGVANKLWIRALSKSKPKYVDVMVASRGGMKLVKSLKNKFKKISWTITKL